MEEWKERSRTLGDRIHELDPHYVPPSTENVNKEMDNVSYAAVAAGRSRSSSRHASPCKMIEQDAATPAPIQDLSCATSALAPSSAPTKTEDKAEIIARERGSADTAQEQCKVQQNFKGNVQMKKQGNKEKAEAATRRGRSPTRKQAVKAISKASEIKKPNVHNVQINVDETEAPANVEKIQKPIECYNQQTLVPKDEKRVRSPSPIWLPGSTSYADILRGHACTAPSDTDEITDEILPVDNKDSSAVTKKLSPIKAKDFQTKQPIKSVADDKVKEKARDDIIYPNKSAESSNKMNSSAEIEVQSWADEPINDLNCLNETVQDPPSFINPMSQLTGPNNSELKSYSENPYMLSVAQDEPIKQVESLVSHSPTHSESTDENVIAPTSLISSNLRPDTQNIQKITPTTSVNENQPKIIQNQNISNSQSNISTASNVVTKKSETATDNNKIPVCSVENQKAPNLPLESTQNIEVANVEKFDTEQTKSTANIEKLAPNLEQPESNESSFSYAQILSQGLTPRELLIPTSKQASSTKKERSISPKSKSLTAIPILPELSKERNSAEVKKQNSAENKEQNSTEDKEQNSAEDKEQNWDVIKKKETKRKQVVEQLPKKQENSKKLTNSRTEKPVEIPSKSNVSATDKKIILEPSKTSEGEQMKNKKTKSIQEKEKIVSEQIPSDNLIVNPADKKKKQKKKKHDKLPEDEIDKALKEIEDMDKQKTKIVKDKSNKESSKCKIDTELESERKQKPKSKNKNENIINESQGKGKSEENSDKTKNIKITQDDKEKTEKNLDSNKINNVNKISDVKTCKALPLSSNETKKSDLENIQNPSTTTNAENLTKRDKKKNKQQLKSNKSPSDSVQLNKEKNSAEPNKIGVSNTIETSKISDNTNSADLINTKKSDKQDSNLLLKADINKQSQKKSKKNEKTKLDIEVKQEKQSSPISDKLEKDSKKESNKKNIPKEKHEQSPVTNKNNKIENKSTVQSKVANEKNKKEKNKKESPIVEAIVNLHPQNIQTDLITTELSKEKDILTDPTELSENIQGKESVNSQSSIISLECILRDEDAPLFGSVQDRKKHNCHKAQTSSIIPSSQNNSKTEKKNKKKQSIETLMDGNTIKENISKVANKKEKQILQKDLNLPKSLDKSDLKKSIIPSQTESDLHSICNIKKTVQEPLINKNTNEVKRSLSIERIVQESKMKPSETASVPESKSLPGTSKGAKSKSKETVNKKAGQKNKNTASDALVKEKGSKVELKTELTNSSISLKSDEIVKGSVNESISKGENSKKKDISSKTVQEQLSKTKLDDLKDFNVKKVSLESSVEEQLGSSSNNLQNKAAFIKKSETECKNKMNLNENEEDIDNQQLPISTDMSWIHNSQDDLILSSLVDIKPSTGIQNFNSVLDKCLSEIDIITSESKMIDNLNIDITDIDKIDAKNEETNILQEEIIINESQLNKNTNLIDTIVTMGNESTDANHDINTNKKFEKANTDEPEFVYTEIENNMSVEEENRIKELVLGNDAFIVPADPVRGAIKRGPKEPKYLEGEETLTPEFIAQFIEDHPWNADLTKEEQEEFDFIMENNSLILDAPQFKNRQWFSEARESKEARIKKQYDKHMKTVNDYFEKEDIEDPELARNIKEAEKYLQQEAASCKASTDTDIAEILKLNAKQSTIAELKEYNQNLVKDQANKTTEIEKSPHKKDIPTNAKSKQLLPLESITTIEKLKSDEKISKQESNKNPTPKKAELKKNAQKKNENKKIGENTFIQSCTESIETEKIPKNIEKKETSEKKKSNEKSSTESILNEQKSVVVPLSTDSDKNDIVKQLHKQAIKTKQSDIVNKQGKKQKKIPASESKNSPQKESGKNINEKERLEDIKLKEERKFCAIITQSNIDKTVQIGNDENTIKIDSISNADKKTVSEMCSIKPVDSIKEETKNKQQNEVKKNKKEQSKGSKKNLESKEKISEESSNKLLKSEPSDKQMQNPKVIKDTIEQQGLVSELEVDTSGHSSINDDCKNKKPLINDLQTEKKEIKESVESNIGNVEDNILIKPEYEKLEHTNTVPESSQNNTSIVKVPENLEIMDDDKTEILPPKSKAVEVDDINKIQPTSYAKITAKQTQEILKEDTNDPILAITKTNTKESIEDETLVPQIQILNEEKPIEPIENIVHVDDQGFLEVVSKKELRSRRSRSRSRSLRRSDEKSVNEVDSCSNKKSKDESKGQEIQSPTVGHELENKNLKEDSQIVQTSVNENKSLEKNVEEIKINNNSKSTSEPNKELNIIKNVIKEQVDNAAEKIITSVEVSNIEEGNINILTENVPINNSSAQSISKNTKNDNEKKNKQLKDVEAKEIASISQKSLSDKDLTKDLQNTKQCKKDKKNIKSNANDNLIQEQIGTKEQTNINPDNSTNKNKSKVNEPNKKISEIVNLNPKEKKNTIIEHQLETGKQIENNSKNTSETNISTSFRNTEEKKDKQVKDCIESEVVCDYEQKLVLQEQNQPIADCVLKSTDVDELPKSKVTFYVDDVHEIVTVSQNKSKENTPKPVLNINPDEEVSEVSPPWINHVANDSSFWPNKHSYEKAECALFESLAKAKKERKTADSSKKDSNGKDDPDNDKPGKDRKLDSSSISQSTNENNGPPQTERLIADLPGGIGSWSDCSTYLALKKNTVIDDELKILTENINSSETMKTNTESLASYPNHPKPHPNSKMNLGKESSSSSEMQNILGEMKIDNLALKIQDSNTLTIKVRVIVWVKK
jgi:nesprin-1